MAQAGEPRCSASQPRRRRGAGVRTGVAALVAFLTIVALATPVAPDAAGAASTRPNIVFILTDDLSWNLITPQIAPHIVQLEHEGETFTNYYVADSLCCPSRATIFTGLFPHDTKVTTNEPPYGGYTKFVSGASPRRVSPSPSRRPATRRPSWASTSTVTATRAVACSSRRAGPTR